MKYVAWRSHKARPADYESVDIGARVEIDTEVDTEFADMSATRISRFLEEELDDLLETPARRVVDSGGNQIEDSHLWEFYGLD